MSYYFLHQEKRLPSLVVYSFLIVLTIGMSFFMRNIRLNTNSKAAQSTPPENVTVSNTTNASATISFTTIQAASSFVQYGKKGVEPSSIAFDARDTQKPTKRTAHYITLTNLDTNTSYSFTIQINGKTYTSTKYLFQTYGSIQKSPGHSPLFGKVVGKNLKPAQGVLATLTLPHIATSQVFTTVSGSDGSWMIAIPLVQDKDGNSLTLDDSTTVYIDFTDGVTTSHIVTTLLQTSPLQSVVLGKDKTSPNVLGSETQKITLKNLQIAFPQDGAVIPSRFVRFRGIAQASSTLQLTIEPIHLQTSVKTNVDGVWEFQNTTALTAGTYTLNVSSEIEKASTSVLFNVGKNGESVLGDATASATLTITPIPTESSIDPTPTPIPSSSPTSPTTPTDIMTVSPTLQPTSIIAKNSIPTTGFSNNFLIVLASTFSLLGMILLLY
ncbi:MAG: hypothetical protein NUV65_05510 [Candidatus Roizmanbacteria bacterium]|nr:hypothetical protein [Candidatus Roizmanbacteria bacterium]